MAWQAILGGALSLGASAINQGISGANTRRGREWQEMMYERQLQDQLKYNSPNYQVAQMKNSGLNPYLLTDGLTNYSSSTPSAPPVAHGQIDSSIPLQTALLDAQIENIKADTNLKNTDAGLKGSEKNLNDITLANLDEQQKTQIMKMEAEISNLITNTEFTFMSEQKLEKECLQIDKQIDLMSSQIGLNDQQKELIKADTFCKYFYAYLEREKVDIAWVNTALAKYGLKLQEDGLTLERDKLTADINFRQLDIDLRKALLDHNVAIDWANFGANVLSQTASILTSAIPSSALIGKSANAIRGFSVKDALKK